MWLNRYASIWAPSKWVFNQSYRISKEPNVALARPSLWTALEKKPRSPQQTGLCLHCSERAGCTHPAKIFTFPGHLWHFCSTEMSLLFIWAFFSGSNERKVLQRLCLASQLSLMQESGSWKALHTLPIPQNEF